MRSIVLHFSCDGGGPVEFKHTFYPPLQSATAFEEWAEIAITQFSTYYCKKNVSKSNNKFYYDSDKMVEIPEGAYSVNSLDDELKNLLGHENILLMGHEATGKIGLWCRFSVDFSRENNLAELLGFKSGGELSAGKVHFAEKSSNLHATEALHIKCDNCEGAILNGRQSDIIHTVILNVEPQFKVVSIPTRAIYHRLRLGNISELKFSIVDDKGEPLEDWQAPILLQAHLILNSPE
jgi:hypothetical protein